MSDIDKTRAFIKKMQGDLERLKTNTDDPETVRVINRLISHVSDFGIGFEMEQMRLISRELNLSGSEGSVLEEGQANNQQTPEPEPEPETGPEDRFSFQVSAPAPRKKVPFGIHLGSVFFNGATGIGLASLFQADKIIPLVQKLIP
jgi:hypothetical protein